MTDIADRVRIAKVTILSSARYVLKQVAFAWRRRDGRWQDGVREVYDRGDGAAILLYNRARRSVVLTRQFRLPAFLGGYREELIEAAAGLLDDAHPEERIRAEAEEETGYRVGAVTKLFVLFTSPGAVTEKLHFFAAEYDAAAKVGAGGGLEDEGEDIAVLELGLDAAMAMVADGRICDAKTVVLLQWAKLNGI